ncbi:MAG: Ig-like domain-containing protein, partial [Pseudomonadota bacterium]
ENIVQNGDFSEHRLKDNQKWGTMQDTGDGSWVAETGRIEVQKSTGHGGTPANKVKSTVLELDSLTGRKGLGATNSNSVVTQEIEEIDGPGTYRLSLDYKGATKHGLSVEETGTAEIWVGDKLVAVLSQDKRGWEERIVEFTLDEADIPADGVELKLVATGRADGKGAQLDNISLREIGDTGLLGEELVTNGGFEDHPAMGNKGAFEAIPGWSVSDDSVIELKSVRKPITPRDKSDSYVELDSHGDNSNSTVVQNIDVPEDGTYLLSFDYSPRAARGKNAEATSPIKVMVGDEVVAEISAQEVGWKPFTFNVDLAEGPVKLSFEGTGVEDKVGGLLDNVALRKVGELAEDATPINAPLEAEDAAGVAATQAEVYESGLLGEVFFADEKLTKLDQALTHVDDTPDATFIATEIDYGNNTGWFHTDLDFVLEHDGDSLVEHTEGALDKNVNHTAMQLTGEIYLEAGTHKFFNRTDDGFRLTIDGQELAEYEGLRAARTTKGEIEVEADGWYDIQIDYFDWQGHSKLRVEHDGPEGSRQLLDDARLRHKVEVDNQGPDAIDDAAEGVEGSSITIDALGNDTDPDGDTVFIVDATDGANGTVTFIPPNVEEVAAAEAFTLGENLIVNGDFEDNPLNGKIGWGHWDTIEGWESPVGRIEVQTNNYGTGNMRGNAVVELDSHGSNSNATLQQEVQVEEAGAYQFSLDYAMRGKHGWTNGVGIKINGEVVHEVIKPTEKGFHTITLDVELDPGTAIVEIYALGKQDTIGTVIDNVSLRQVQDSDPVRVFTAPDGGLITYTPEPGFSGTDTFTYTISDGNGGTDTATVTVVVDPGNQAPVAADDQIETPEDTAITVDLLANDQDPDGDAITITELGPVENGTLELNADGTVTFTPQADFHGEVTFEYTISDGELTSTATATIVVTPVNDPVIANDDQDTTREDRSVNVRVLDNDIDVDGDVLTITELGDVENGTLRLNGDGTIRFTPDDDFYGTVTFD